MRLRTAVPMLLLLLLCACGAANDTGQTPLSLRAALNDAQGCTFRLELEADLGDQVRNFTLDCTGTPEGDATLTVQAPEAVQGIRANVSGDKGQVSYDDTILAVERISSRDLSPMAAPGLLTAAWGQGYISAAGQDGALTEVHYLLGEGQRELEVTTWFQGEIPVRAEISDGGRRLITCGIKDFILNEKAKEHANQETAETDLGGSKP